MITNSNYTQPKDKSFSSNDQKLPGAAETEDDFILHTAASGDLPNDKVPNCYTCKKHGHPHEAITFEKVNGRLRNDGTKSILSLYLGPLSI